MSDNWTSRRIRKALGVKKCNGSWDAAVEELTMDQVISVSYTHLTLPTSDLV